MGFCEILTILFIALKLFGVITWSWWLVLLPEIIAVILYAVIVIAGIVCTTKADKAICKSFDDFDRFNRF